MPHSCGLDKPFLEVFLLEDDLKGGADKVSSLELDACPFIPVIHQDLETPP
jgi:hypothetical protein